MPTDMTERRLQLFKLGYSIIPSYGKIARLTGWNTPAFAAREYKPGRIDGWPGRWPDLQSTGVRIEGGLRAIDVDVDDGPIVDALLDYIAAIAPDVARRAPTRYGGGRFKLTLFGRMPNGDEIFSCFPSNSYLRPGDAEDEDHKVELFGGGVAHNGNCARHCGIYGPHSYNSDGSIAVEYCWAEGVPALHEMALAELPLLSKADMYAIAGEFERLAEAAGWQKIERPDVGKSRVIYDIDENSRFNTDRAGSGLNYVELCEAQAVHSNLRCSSSFIDGRHGKKVDRCWVFYHSRHNCVGVYVYGDETTHYPKELAPQPDAIEEAIKVLQAMQKPVSSVPERPEDGDPIAEKALWLGLSYGYCALTDTVIELYKPADDCQLKPPAFQRLFRAWREATKGKKGGIKYAYATSYWEVNPARLDLEGVRMRPDQPFPLYLEGGRRFKNTYLRPQHQGSGDIGPWLEYMRHLLPNAVEREWFCNWLAHKHLHPGVPGVAVIMVATGPDGPIYGAGRGLLRDIIARLLGPKYVKPIDFDVFTGRSSQGIYTDWGAYSTLITVNEAKDMPESGRWTERRAVYERLREIVDPRAIERTFIRKGQQAFSGLSFASYLVFSNNRDALQIPEGDRRMAALANGERMKPEMADRLQKWMDVSGNIAELARWLEGRDLSQFDAYAPPVTETKTTMQELARSELDDAFDAVRRRIGPQRLFTGEQIRTAVLTEMGDVMSADIVKSWVNRRVRAEATQVGTYKMTPTEGRHKILAWRGWAGRWAGDSMAAQTAVHKTAEILIDRSSETVPWPGTGAVTGDKVK